MKQVILIRTDLKMPKGKLVAQAAHAAVAATLKSKKEKVNAWQQQGAKKVAVKVESKTELFKLIAKAKLQGLTTATIRDGAKTFFKVPTITCSAIGPHQDEKIDKITKDLSLL